MTGPVLDPFAGSGTSLFVAAEMGLDAVGIELLPCSTRSSKFDMPSYTRTKQRLQEAFVSPRKGLRRWNQVKNAGFRT